MTGYSLDNLPKSLRSIFLNTQILQTRSVKAHRPKLEKTFPLSADDVRSVTAKSLRAVALSDRSYKSEPVIWATDNYSEELNHGFADAIADSKDLQATLEAIVPRRNKALALQKQRTKEKAEVFTPSWVCNLQNNLADDHSIREGAFNTTSDGGKTWIPSSGKVFKDKQEAVAYISSPRLEITCGEAPYLVSRYDTVSGEDIPVRDTNGNFQRIGILDRKLRVAAELAGKDYYTWEFLALESLKATYGYEWQGDSLLLARLNLFNSFLDYRSDFVKGIPKEQRKAVGKKPSKELLKEVAEIICWNVWQMDGLKMVVPGSCSAECLRCQKGRLKDPMQKHWGHDGILPVIRFKGLLIPFEDMVFYRTSSKQLLTVSRARVKPEDEPVPIPKRLSLFDFGLQSIRAE